MSKYDYVKYDEISTQKQAQIKNAFDALTEHLETSLPGGRYKALCMTSLEEAYMWTGKATRDEQLARNKLSQMQEERSNTVSSGSD